MLIYLRSDLSIGIFSHSSGYYSILAIAIKIRLCTWAKSSKMLALSLSLPLLDFRRIASIIKHRPRVFNLGMEWRFARVHCRSFIFHVNAADALISAFDNISFFSICSIGHWNVRCCSCQGIIGCVLVLYVCIRSDTRQLYILIVEGHHLFTQF